ncbi:hypothetical protein D3C78_1157440 [compost metagenome]
MLVTIFDDRLGFDFANSFEPTLQCGRIGSIQVDHGDLIGRRNGRLAHRLRRDRLGHFSLRGAKCHAGERSAGKYECQQSRKANSFHSSSLIEE